MATTILTHQKSEFSRGLMAGTSIAIGYLPAALTFGLLAKGTGLSFFEAMAMSMFVFAGAAQYMALNLLAIGTGAFEIIFTTFIVNIRHLLMSASVNERVEEAPPFIKAIYSFGLTDEVFAVSSTQEGTVRTGFIFGVALMAYTSWVINTGAGYLVGSLLPASLQASMAIALYAMFIALLIPSVKKERKIFYLAATAAMLNGVFSLVMPSGWSIVLATLMASIAIEYIPKKGG
ncbi:AzlC family ABC transporter permease [Bacillus sp. FJAT-45037]|uniref:AzlC family ABC transporter permease n=1 Tax=Bacillus sp. FJAT-45037 TaxID=2011007 RepID=UPI000C249D0B|nr:AzlC family ABC transporter permease [Bacillus sp. FJAT-45037]